MKKTKKFLNLTLLSIATISLPLTFLISSCVENNDEELYSKIIIDSQSPSIINVTTQDAPPKLFVNAKSNYGNLKYTWFVSKDDGANWNEIIDANSNSYQIPNSDFNNATNNETWQYKVQINLENNESINLTSNIYKINVKSINSLVNVTQDLLPNISISSDEDISLSISTISNSINSLKYDWYLKKPNDNFFIKVQNSVNNSFNLYSSNYLNIKNKEIWKVYVEVYPEGGESSKRTSITCSIEITPQTIRENSSNEITPSATTIYPRENTIITNPLTKDGYTTVKYNTEKWIGKNAVSILRTSEPNLNYLKKYVNDYLKKYESDIESSNIPDKYGYTLMSFLKNSLDSGTYNLSASSGGTGWILDYSYDSSKDLVSYYIATNIHVLDATYTINYDAYINNIKQTVTATVPINSNTVNYANMYLSQPQYNETNANNNINVLASQKSNLSTDWYKTSIDKNSMTSNLIPIGAYTSKASPSLGSSYELQLSYREMVDFIVTEHKYSFKTDLNRLETVPSYSTKESSDFAVLKITEQKNKFDKFPSNQETYKPMFENIQKMFKIDSNNSNVKENSSYIDRLNYLNQMLTNNQYSKSKVDELFMFSDYKKDISNIDTISIAGFPALYKTENGTDKTYVTFNSNTMSYYLHTNYYGTTSRPYLEYYYNGGNYYSKYNWPVNDLYAGINLQPGSSGSMGITDKYKIAGIYWGGIYDTKFMGALTNIYSWTDDKSMIKIWLKYVEEKDPNSKLLALFTGLNNKSYFS